MMRKILVSGILCLFALCVFAQNKNVSANKNADEDRTAAPWSQLEVLKINKEAPRAFFVSHFTEKGASKIVSLEDVDKIYEIDSAKVLNGKWKFFFANAEGDVKKEFFAKDFNDQKWNLIDVPCSWQSRGFDTAFYNNTGINMMFNKEGHRLPQYGGKNGEPSEFAQKPWVPDEYKQRGVYRHKFTLPNNWSEKEIYLRFNGVRTAFNLYVNGKFVGYSQDSFTPAEFNISKFLNGGENTIALEVFKFSVCSVLEMQDMPQLMGITRDVILLARPALQIKDYYAPYKISDDLKNLKIDFNVEIKNLSKKTFDGARLEVFLIDTSDGKKLPLFTKSSNRIDPNSDAVIKETISLNSFKLWSPDKPQNAYQLVIKLEDAFGKTQEAIAADFAFRKFEYRGDQFFFNNVNFKIKGTNHHDWSPDNGKSMSFDWMKKDIILMKQANLNGVRTSHYPKDDKFYMLCTRYGLLVLDENNFETHSLWDDIPGELDCWVPPALDRMTNMVIRDRNIPCVFIFSTNNESSPGNHYAKALREMEKLSRQLDPTRPVHSESGLADKQNTTDFDSPMYGGIGRMKHYLRFPEPRKPFFFCEYTHAMGNAMGNFKDTWNLMRSHQGLNGGFIWDWVDQGMYMPIPENPQKNFISDGRDWGTLPTARNFSHNGVIFADRSFGVKYAETKQVYQDIQIDAINADEGKIKITNEFFDINVNEFAAKIAIERDGEKIAESTLPPFNVNAGESKEFTINYPKYDKSKDGDYYARIDFTRKSSTNFADKDSIASSEQFKLFSKRTKQEFAVKNIRPSIEKKGDTITVKSGNAEYKFLGGNLSSYKIEGTEMLVEPIEFDIKSAWTDNTRSGEEHILRDLGIYSCEEKSSKIEHKINGSCAEISVKKVFAHQKEGFGYSYEIIYKILPDGLVQIRSYMRKVNEMPYDLRLPRIGLKMRLNKNLSAVEFLGRGPWMNYNDRKQAQFFGKYKVAVADGVENYSWPQDQGNREEVQALAITEPKSGRGIMFSATEKSLPMAWLPNTQTEILEAKHPHNLPESLGAEIRIAHSVLGIGNASCGPRTLEEYSNFFKGEVMWEFVISPILKGQEKIEIAGRKIWPEKYNDFRTPETENLIDESYMFIPNGDWISEGAKTSYSSVDEKYAPKKDTLTTTGEWIMSFHTLQENKPFVIIDLGENKNIGGAIILNRDDKGLYDRAVPLEMFVSEDGKNWKKVWRTKSPKGIWKARLEKTENARYVKLQVDKHNATFHLKSVKILGANK